MISRSSQRAKRRLVLVLGLLVGITLRMDASALHPVADGMWLAGDLHVHTIWGHDTCIDPATAWDNTKPDFAARVSCEEPWTWSFTPLERLQDAEQRGLDFLAISDHNNVMTLLDPGYLSYTGKVIKIGAYEKSLAGHVQMLGVTSCFNNDGPVATPLVECQKNIDQTIEGIGRLATSLRTTGGVFQVNHPSDHDWERIYGYTIVPDTMEVWNIGSWFYQRPNLSANDNDFALKYWDGFLSAGHRIGATGGSDSHWRILSPQQGVGQPTTWVWATARTSDAILEGLRKGRTFISHESPLRAGTKLFLEADADGDGVFESKVGDSVPAGSTLRVTATKYVPGSILRVVTDSQIQESVLSAPVQTLKASGSKYVRVELRLPDAIEVRQEHCDYIAREIEEHAGASNNPEREITYCRNRIVMQALTSPIYFD